jgi:chromosome segregation ATPase
LAQHQTDRDEIARLNQALFDRNNASIDDLKGVLGKIHGVGEDAAATRSLNEELEKLKELTERRTDEVHILRSQLDQKDAAIDMVRSNLEAQIKLLEDEVARLQSELDRPRDDAPSRILADKLTLELRKKDERMRKLDAAIKQVQAELTEALKRKADEAIQGSSWRQQERLEERLADLEAQNKTLIEALQMSKDEVAALTMHAGEGGEREHAAAITRLQAQLVEVSQTVSFLQCREAEHLPASLRRPRRWRATSRLSSTRSATRQTG